MPSQPARQCNVMNNMFFVAKEKNERQGMALDQSVIQKIDADFCYHKRLLEVFQGFCS